MAGKVTSKKAAKEFEKLAKKIRSSAADQGLIAISNRVKLFIHGKPARRWWFADKKSGILFSAEYGIVDSEAEEFLSHAAKG